MGPRALAVRRAEPLRVVGPAPAPRVVLAAREPGPRNPCVILVLGVRPVVAGRRRPRARPPPAPAAPEPRGRRREEVAVEARVPAPGPAARERCLASERRCADEVGRRPGPASREQVAALVAAEGRVSTRRTGPQGPALPRTTPERPRRRRYPGREGPALGRAPELPTLEPMTPKGVVPRRQDPKDRRGRGPTRTTTGSLRWWK